MGMAQPVMLWEQRAAHPCWIYSHMDDNGVKHWDYYAAHKIAASTFNGKVRHNCPRCGMWLEDAI